MEYTLTVSLICFDVLSILALLIAFRKGIFNSGAEESNLKDRVKALEKQSSDIASDIKSIKENHLTHMQADISAINVTLAGINATLEYLKDK